MATTLRDLSGQLTPAEDFLIAWRQRFWDLLETLARDPTGLGSRYDELCLQKGEMLIVDQGPEMVAGRCVGVAPDGALLLDTASGRRTVYGGRLVKKDAATRTD